MFTRLDDENTGVNGHNRNEIFFWRKVIDEMLLAWCGANSSAVEHSQRWFNSKPGEIDFYYDIDQDTGEDKVDPITGERVKVYVDAYEEYAEVCARANLDPDFVRNKATEIVKRIREEEKTKKPSTTKRRKKRHG